MNKTAYIMSKGLRGAPWSAALCATALALGARADAPDEHIVTRVSVEVVARPAQIGAEPTLQTAERVVPGDVLIYTVEVRNTGPYSVESAVVIQPIPKHTMYVAESAVGPGVDVDYSIDAGRSFAPAPRLHAAVAEYTHIRWRLHNRLKPGSVAFVRFRAQVK